MNNNERRLHDAKLCAAIENAAGNLPEDFSVSIHVERDAAVVSLNAPGGHDLDYFYGEDLADAINEAVEKAVAYADAIEA